MTNLDVKTFFEPIQDSRYDVTKNPIAIDRDNLNNIVTRYTPENATRITTGNISAYNSPTSGGALLRFQMYPGVDFKTWMSNCYLKMTFQT